MQTVVQTHFGSFFFLSFSSSTALLSVVWCFALLCIYPYVGIKWLKVLLCIVHLLYSLIYHPSPTPSLSLYLLSLCFFFSLLNFVAAMISYNVVVGDTLSKVLLRFLPNWDFSMGTVRFLVVFVVTVCVVIPLCLYKNVSRLARASFISLACVVFILFAVILKFISGDYDVV